MGEDTGWKQAEGKFELSLQRDHYRGIVRVLEEMNEARRNRHWEVQRMMPDGNWARMASGYCYTSDLACKAVEFLIELGI